MLGWLYGENIEIDCLAECYGSIEKSGNGQLYTNLKSKFYNDIVCKSEGVFLEGYISNKAEIVTGYNGVSWEEIHESFLQRADFPMDYRGSFCGYDVTEKKKLFYTDHIGSKSLYYYVRGDIIIVSTKLYWIAQVLKHNGIKYSFNEDAAKYMMTYGFMLDDTTFIKEVKRILPGNKIIVEKGIVNSCRYYIPAFHVCEDLSEEEAVNRIDEAFRKAVKREFEKDREYGYKHLVDLSGGLDSRMVTWVAHEMGYHEQINISYCKSGYLDYAIASAIAKDLKHEFYYNQLDDFRWMCDIDESLRLNNGQALVGGITGGKRFLSNLNQNIFGIEHTGMVGDVVISCFARDKEKALSAPEFGKNQESNYLKYDFDEKILSHYENQEVFAIYTRGFLGAMSTYSIRQNYVEVASPFLDVDMLNVCFSLPLEYRCNHKIYLNWIKKYYPQAADYGWEKWAGVHPKEEYRLLRIGVYGVRKLKRMIRGMLGYAISDNMNPFDYWYSTNKEVREYFEQYYVENIQLECIGEQLKKDIDKLFKNGRVSEKAQALTVLGMAKNYF